MSNNNHTELHLPLIAMPTQKPGESLQNYLVRKSRAQAWNGRVVEIWIRHAQRKLFEQKQEQK